MIKISKRSFVLNLIINGLPSIQRRLKEIDDLIEF